MKLLEGSAMLLREGSFVTPEMMQMPAAPDASLLLVGVSKCFEHVYIPYCTIWGDSLH